MKHILLLLISLLSLPSCSKGNGVTQAEPPAESGRSVRVVVGNSAFTATLASGAAAAAFKALLPLTLTMSDFNNNEKVCSLPSSLTTSASSPGTIHAGDIMLYGSNSLVLFYETFSSSYSYTRIGQIDNPAGLKAVLGKGSVTIKFE